MTFSLIARCARTGQFGIAVSSSSIAVAARCGRWARAVVGVVATQNITDPGLGLIGLNLLGEGLAADAVLERLKVATPYTEYRQLGVLDAAGRHAYFTGSGTLGVHAMHAGENCMASGNLLANPEVPQSMVERFAALASQPLAQRLLGALRAGLDAGGEAGPVRSAGLLVVDRYPWPIVDLRVDWHDDPVGALEQAWAVYGPQMHDYIARAINPSAAPGYGVPGDAR